MGWRLLKLLGREFGTELIVVLLVSWRRVCLTMTDYEKVKGLVEDG